jgi:glucosamine--fructose-6-phosphate aminotransferase (isomerizing)
LIDGLRSLEPRIERLAAERQSAHDALFLGRGPMYPIALEGALKLKEISYVHAEGYPAGEMKHGPIALIEPHLPIVALMPRDEHRERTLSNLHEAAARQGWILAFATEGETALDGVAADLVELPRITPWLAPILFTVPMQLFAYHTARLLSIGLGTSRSPSPSSEPILRFAVGPSLTARRTRTSCAD